MHDYSSIGHLKHPELLLLVWEMCYNRTATQEAVGQRSGMMILGLP